MIGEVPSPCTKVCVLDAAGESCTGCLRTLDEIVRWGGLAREERARVVASLPGRRRASSRDPER